MNRNPSMMPISAAELIKLLEQFPASHPIFVATATGATFRPAMSVDKGAGKIVITCAPPNSASWTAAADWSLSDAVLAKSLGISRQAVHAMRKRVAGVKRKPKQSVGS